MKRLSLPIIFCLLILNAATGIAQVASDYYFSLRVDNYWNYHTDGTPSGWSPRTTIYTIEGTDFIAGKQYFVEKQVEIMDNNPTYTYFIHALWLREDSLGNILIGAYGVNSTILDSAVLFDLPYPVVFPNEYLNAGYSREMLRPDGLYEQDSVISTTELVNVPAGTFNNCLKICNQVLDTNRVIIRRTYVFYAYGVGIVKAVREIPANDAHTQNLIQYVAIPSAVEDKTLPPDGFVLSQNYPNPFNPSTIISYSLPVISQVSLKIYDVLGKEIANLINEEKSAGEYEVEFNANHLSSGIYFYQLKAGSFLETKKMLMLK